MGDLEDEINRHPHGPLVPRERQGFRAMFEEWSGIRRTRARVRRTVTRWLAWGGGTVALALGLSQLPEQFGSALKYLSKLLGKG